MIIGLCGEIAAGKDATYLRAKELVGDRFEVEQVAFATKMKESIAAIFDIDLSVLEEAKRDDDSLITFEVGDTVVHLTFREFIQRFGTEAHRGVFGDLFWVNAALPLDLDHAGKLVFVTDVRFPSEQQRTVDLGGVNLLVKSDEQATPKEASHSSETSLDFNLIDFIVDNRARDDNFASLDRQITAILKKVLKGQWRP